MSQIKTKTKTGIKTERKTERKTLINIESIGVEIESCVDNSVLWRPIVYGIEGIEYLHDVEWHNDGSISCSEERRKYSNKDMVDSEFTAWTDIKHVNYIFKLYEALYEKATLRQNKSTGNHIHIRFKEPIDYYIVTSPSFIYRFQYLYSKKYALDSKYIDRLNNRFSVEYSSINDIIDNQLSGSRYRTINALSLVKHRSWTVEFRILPYADNPVEYRHMVTWLITTVDNLITEYKAKLKPLGRKFRYDKEGLRVGNEILGNDTIKVNHIINDNIPGISWLHMQSAVMTDLLNRKYGLNISHVTFSTSISPLALMYVYYHDLSIIRKKAMILSDYGGYVDDRRVLIPSARIDNYNKDINERINTIRDTIGKYFNIPTSIGTYVNSPEYSDSIFNPITAISIRYDWNVKQIKIIVSTGSIRGGGYLAISVDSMAKRYVKNMVGLIKFLKENILELRIMNTEPSEIQKVIA